MTTTTTKSLQLPDLLSFCSAFELRTNRHCRTVSQASEKWLSDSGIVLSSTTWRAAKHGLLAAACHPSADVTQLRLVADALGLLWYHRQRTTLDPDVFAPLADRLSRVAYKHPRWYMRFVKSQRRYLEARAQRARDGVQGVVPDLESYVDHARDASGFRMALDMVQYAGDVHLSDAVLEDATFWRLHDHACDVAAWSVDVVACAKGGTREANLVTILKKERHVPIECAVVAAGHLIRQSVEAFMATADALLSVPEYAADRELARYVRGLGDWIVGFVNWLYETELFLGDKGSEVRAFGWVFVPVPR